jgi:hypothetical protein
MLVFSNTECPPKWVSGSKAEWPPKGGHSPKPRKVSTIVVYEYHYEYRPHYQYRRCGKLFARH